MPRVKYTKRLDGEDIQIKGRSHIIRCCDCGLVHLLKFRLRESRLSFRAYRDERRTAASRRSTRYAPVEGEPK